MPKLSGKVDLDFKDALRDLRAFRRELKGVTSDSTKVKIDVSDAKRASGDLTSAQKRGISDVERAQAAADKASVASARAAAAQRTKLIAEGKAAAGQLATSFARVSQIGGLAIAGAFGASLKVLTNYDSKLRNVNSIAQLGSKDFDKLSDSVKKISADPNIKKGPTDLAEGLYDVYSAGYKGAEALDVLKESAISASAGVSSTKVGVDAITTALRAHIKGVDSARQASNYYFQTVNDGKITFTQLASAIGNGAAKIHAGGLSMAEFGAVMANATLKGTKSARAVTQLNNLIDKIAAPKPKAAEEFEKLGIKIGYSELKAVGFTAKMKEITEKTGGSADALRKLLPDQRAFDAALTLTSDKMVGYNALLEKQRHANDGAGAAARAAAKQNQGLSNDVDQAKKNLELFALTAAGVVAPSVSKLLHVGTDLLRNFQALPKDVQESKIKMVALAGGALLLVSPLKSIVETGLLVSKVTRGISAAMAAARAAKLASAAASTVLAGADTTAAAAATELAAAEGAAGAGAAGVGAGAAEAAVGTAAFGAGFVALAAVAVVATGAIGAYKINQEVVNENNAKLKSSNADLVFSNKQTATSFDVLRKSASVDAGASKTVSELAAQYEKLKGSAAGLDKFSKIALPSARREIALNVKLTMPQKAELNRQIDQVSGQINANMKARKFDVSVKAQADKGTLENVKIAFFRTYGELYFGITRRFYDPAAAGASVLWGGLKSGASATGAAVKTNWNLMLSNMDMATNGAASKMAATFQNLGARIGNSIKNAASRAWSWYNGRTANHGETELNMAPASAPTVKGAPKSQIWLDAHPGYGADGARIAGARAKGGPVEAGKTYLVGEEGPELFVAPTSGNILSNKQSRKAGVVDFSKSAAEYEAASKRMQDASEKSLQKLSALREGFAGLFSDTQSELISLGQTKNPLGPLVENMGHLLDLSGRARREALAARREIKSSNIGANRASARENAAQNTDFGGDFGDVAASGGARGTKAGAKSLFEKYNIRSTVDMTCADVASKTIAGLGIAIKKSVNAGQLEKNVIAAGWQRVDPRTAPLGSAVFKYSASARSKTHAMMGMGDGTLASSSNHKTSYFDARGSERAYAPPTPATSRATGGIGKGLTQKGAGTMSALGLSSADLGAIDAVLRGDTSFNLSSVRALGAGWGQSVKSNDKNGATFGLQSKLASGEDDALIKELGLAIAGGRAQQRAGNVSPDSMGAALSNFAQLGVHVNWKKGWTSNDVALDFLKQISGLEDARLNATRAADEAASKARENMNAQIAGVKSARVEIAAQNGEQARGLDQLREQAAWMKANPIGGADWDRMMEKRRAVKEYRNSDAVKSLFNAGRIDEGTKAMQAFIANFSETRRLTDQMNEDAAQSKSTNEALTGYYENLNSMPKFADQASEAQDKLNALLDDDTASADSLRAALGALGPAFAVGADVAPKLREKYGDAFGTVDKARAQIGSRREDKLGYLYGENDDLDGRIGDAQARQRDYNQRDWSDGAKLRDQRDRELGALSGKAAGEAGDLQLKANAELDKAKTKWGELISLSDQYEQQIKIDDKSQQWHDLARQGMDGVERAFEDGFQNVMTRQKSFGQSLKDGLQSTLQDMAMQVIRSKLQSLLGNLFLGAVGGGAGKGVAAAAGGGFTPGIAAGLASAPKSGLFGGAGDLGGGFSLGVHASGLDRVPRDNYLMLAHKNEKILAAAEAESYRQQTQANLVAGAPVAAASGGNTTINYVHNGDIVANDPGEYARQLEARGRQSSGPRRASFEQARAGRVALAGGRV